MLHFLLLILVLFDQRSEHITLYSCITLYTDAQYFANLMLKFLWILILHSSDIWIFSTGDIEYDEKLSEHQSKRINGQSYWRCKVSVEVWYARKILIFFSFFARFISLSIFLCTVDCFVKLALAWFLKAIDTLHIYNSCTISYVWIDWFILFINTLNWIGF